MAGNLDTDPQTEVQLLQAIAARLGIDARYIDGQTEVPLLRLILAGISAILASGGGGNMLAAVYDPANIAAQLAGADGQSIDPAAFRAALGANTIGSNLLIMGDPGAIRFIRLNADNSVTQLDAAGFLAAIGGGTSDFSGAYADLSGKPTLGSAAAQDTSAFDVAGAADTAQSNAETTAANALAAKKLDTLAAPDDNTNLDASTSAHGLLPKLDGDYTHFLNGQGGFTTPPGGATIAATTNLIAGDGAGNGADSGINPSNVVTPFLLAWGFVTGFVSPANFEFSVDGSGEGNSSTATTLKVSNNAINGGPQRDNLLRAINGGVVVLFGHDGTKNYYRVTSATDQLTFIELTIVCISGASTAFIDGDRYSFEFLPALAPESGWGTPVSAGDKSINLPDYTPGIDGTMQAALNLVSTGLGDALVADEAQIQNNTKQLQAAITYLRLKGALTS